MVCLWDRKRNGSTITGKYSCRKIFEDDLRCYCAEESRYITYNPMFCFLKKSLEELFCETYHACLCKQQRLRLICASLLVTHIENFLDVTTIVQSCRDSSKRDPERG